MPNTLTRNQKLTYALLGAGILALLLTITQTFALTYRTLDTPVWTDINTWSSYGRCIGFGEQLALMFLFVGLYLGGALYLALRKSLFESRNVYVIALLALMGAVFLRAWLLDGPQSTWNEWTFQFTADYNTFLRVWIDAFRGMTIRDALVTPIGDYNMPYLYILIGISRVPIADVYLIKWVSSLFDIGLAIAVMELVRCYIRKDSVGRGNPNAPHKRQRFAIISLSLALFYPITWLNSAYWAQCDSIYTFFIVLALLFAVKQRPMLSASMAALALSFKLQAIFFLPIYLLIAVVFCYEAFKKNGVADAIRLAATALLTFLATFFATLMPALLAGRPLAGTLEIYVNQTGTNSNFMVLNASTFLAFFFPNITDTSQFDAPSIIRPAMIILAFVFALTILSIGISRWHKNKEDLDARNRDFLTVSLLLSLGIVWLLPQMHDRYYYIADILAVAYAVVHGKKIAWLVPIFVFIGSFAGYSQYLSWWWTGNFRVPIQLGALAIYTAIMLVAALWWFEWNQRRGARS